MRTSEGLAYTKDNQGHQSLYLAMRYPNGFWDIPRIKRIESEFEIASIRHLPTPDGSFRPAYEIRTPHIPNDQFAWVGHEDLEEIAGQSRSVDAGSLALDSLVDIIGSRNTDTLRAPGINRRHWSVMVIKPDAKERGVEPEIFNALSAMGIDVVASTEDQQMTVENVSELWPLAPGETQQDSMRDWWSATIDYMSDGPSSFHLLRGEHVTSRIFDYKQYLRGKYGCSKDESIPIKQRVRSMIHSSETSQELLQNATLKWSPGDLLKLAGTSNERN